METEPNLSGDYFDTPARAERLQLLLHLVRNAGEVLYLRAPPGAGKTRFAQQLLDILGEEMATVWVGADNDSDVPSVAVDQLGLSLNDVSPWPDAVMSALAGQDLLLIIDDADRLGLEAVESLALLHARGGRLLLVGQGGLAQTNGNWDVQFVDLPAFDATQTVAFLRTQAGEHAVRVTDDLAAGLHRAAHGLPGPLLDALHGVLGNAARIRRVQQPATQVLDGPKRPLWPWAFGGLILIMLLSVLLFQDQINALFSPPAGLEEVTPSVAGPAGNLSTIEPATGKPADAAEELRAEAVTALLPEISLPELSREPTQSEIDSMEPAAGPAATPVGATIGQQGYPREEAAAAATATSVDPLDAVMQDALAAAEAGQARAEPAAGPVAVADPRPPGNASAAMASPESGLSDSLSPPVPEEKPLPAAVPAPKKEPLLAAKESTPKQPVGQDAVVQGAVAAKTVENRPVAQDPAAEQPRPAPAPVESRPAAPKTPVVRRPPEAVVSVPPDRGIRWLQGRPPGRYTLQLVGARDRSAVQKYVRDFGIAEPYAIFERDLKGKPWYSLVAGDYADRDAAIAARGRLPKRLGRSGVWPRTFESIQKTK